MTNVSIIIVDDSPTDLMILSALLDMAGNYRTSQASNGGEALDLLQQLADDDQPLPDVCLVDFDMPGMNGLEFIAQARSVHPGPKHILVTGATVADLASAARSAGAEAALCKADLSPSLLEDAIKATLQAAVE